MTDIDLDIEDPASIVLTNHRMVRDGSVWMCQHCKRTAPFGQPMPTPTEPCIPRRWGDQ